MLFIHGIGHFHPNTIIDNAFLESLNIGTNNEWIMERVGIRQRRSVLSLDYIQKTYNACPLEAGESIEFSNLQSGVLACHRALEDAPLCAKDIGMVIAGSSLPQYALPAEACMIAGTLGIEGPAFDINSACSTFAVQLQVINQMSAESLPDYILIVIAENMTRSVDFKDRRVAVLWGDASIAMIVSKTKPSAMRITHTMMASKPEAWNTIRLPVGGHFYQEGPVVQKFAISKTVSVIETLRKERNIDNEGHYFIGHQANLSMLQAICRLAHIPEKRHLYNVDEFGNCGAAGAPSVLSQYKSRFCSGDIILLVVVGAGLTWGGMSIEVL